LLDAGDEVELKDFTTICGIRKLEAEHFSVIFRLLHPFTYGGFVRLGLNDSQSHISTVTQQIIGFFAFFTFGSSST